MKKLWDKNKTTDVNVEVFTAGKDPELDLILAPWDIAGSVAHTIMLAETGLITGKEKEALVTELIKLHQQAMRGDITLPQGTEDIHSYIENVLTVTLGPTGEKVHTARSRNDQVILDIRLFVRDRLITLREKVSGLFDQLLIQSEKYKETLMPGYTHFQVAMPSSFGLWFASFAESLTDDMILLNSAYRVVNQNPLGTAAGYGTSLPVDRKLTTRLLGFEDLVYNSIYAQTGRGKTEKIVAVALASVGATLSSLAMDVILYMSQNFGFLSLPDDYTTGSSIMPHKKNPDAFELIRAYGNRLQALPNEIQLVITNLPGGYHRDKQLLKESLLPAIDQLDQCLEMTSLLIDKIIVKKDILKDPLYNNIFSVNAVNRQVREGVPFREAYRTVAKEIEEGKDLHEGEAGYTHIGSIGNPGNEGIREKMEGLRSEIDPEIPAKSIAKLLDH